jgi:hypothetical protein
VKCDKYLRIEFPSSMTKWEYMNGFMNHPEIDRFITNNRYLQSKHDYPFSPLYFPWYGGAEDMKGDPILMAGWKFNSPPPALSMQSAGKTCNPQETKGGNIQNDFIYLLDPSSSYTIRLSILNVQCSHCHACPT